MLDVYPARDGDRTGKAGGSHIGACTPPLVAARRITGTPRPPYQSDRALRAL